MKKISTTIILATLMINSTWANNFCEKLTGTWQGTYSDPSHLFGPGNFPISLQLTYQKGKIYGYTLATNDGAAGHFGETTGEYYFIANCSKNTLSKVFFVLQHNPLCGDASSQQLKLNNGVTLSKLVLPYENAMTGANLIANLTKQTQASTIDTNLLTQVKNTDNAPIKTCH